MDYPRDIVIAGAGPASYSFTLTLDPNIIILLLEKSKNIGQIGHGWIEYFQVSIISYSQILKFKFKR